MSKGFALAGGCYAGKDFLVAILTAAFPRTTPVSIGGFVKKYALENQLVPGPTIDKARDRAVLDELGKYSEKWALSTYNECKRLEKAGFRPLITDVRKETDVQMVKALHYPIVFVSAPTELRIQRGMNRDAITRQQAVEAMGGLCEQYLDDIVADHTMVNNGKHMAYELHRLFQFLSDEVGM